MKLIKFEAADFCGSMYYNNGRSIYIDPESLEAVMDMSFNPEVTRLFFRNNSTVDVYGNAEEIAEKLQAPEL